MTVHNKGGGSIIFLFLIDFCFFSYIPGHSVILCVTPGGARASLPPIPQIAAQIIQAHETHTRQEHTSTITQEKSTQAQTHETHTRQEHTST